MSVRAARKTDVEQLLGIALEYERASGTYLPERFRDIRRKHEPVAEHRKAALLAQVVDPDAYVLVYDRGDSILGYAIGAIRADEDRVYDRPKTGEFLEVAVLEGYRGKGIAGALWIQLRAWFSDRGCVFVTLSVNANNEAKAIYENWGFEVFYERMIKRLDGAEN